MVVPDMRRTPDLAYFAPQISPAAFRETIFGKTDRLTWRFPRLRPAHINAVTSGLKKTLKRKLTREDRESLARILDRVTMSWLDTRNRNRIRAEEILSQSTGCSRTIIADGLDLAFEEVRGAKLLEALDFIDIFGRPSLLTCIFAGIIPTPMLFDIYLGVLLGCAVFAKAPSHEPFFPILLARSIAAADRRLGSRVAAFWWPGGSWGLEKTLFGRSDLIFAYGSNETIVRIQDETPSKKTLLTFGHKISLALIGRETLTKTAARDLARKAAVDVCLYDQQGCLSPHAIYVEAEPARVQEWAKLLAVAMKEACSRYAPSRMVSAQASLVHQIRAQYQVLPGAWCLSSHPRPDWTVIYDPSPTLAPSCLSRVVFVKPVRDLGQMGRFLRDWKGSLQGFGYAMDTGRAPQLRRLAEKLGVPMVMPVGSMQRLSFRDHVLERQLKRDARGKTAN